MPYFATDNKGRMTIDPYSETHGVGFFTAIVPLVGLAAGEAFRRRREKKERKMLKKMEREEPLWAGSPSVPRPMVKPPPKIVVLPAEEPPPKKPAVPTGLILAGVGALVLVLVLRR